MALFGAAFFLCGCGQDDSPVRETASASETRPDLKSANYDMRSLQRVPAPAKFVNNYWTFRWLGEKRRQRGLCVAMVLPDGGSGSVNCYPTSEIENGRAVQATGVAAKAYESIVVRPRAWTQAQLVAGAIPAPTVRGRFTFSAITTDRPTTALVTKRGSKKVVTLP